MSVGQQKDVSSFGPVFITVGGSLTAAALATFAAIGLINTFGLFAVPTPASPTSNPEGRVAGLVDSDTSSEPSATQTSVQATPSPSKISSHTSALPPPPVERTTSSTALSLKQLSDLVKSSKSLGLRPGDQVEWELPLITQITSNDGETTALVSLNGRIHRHIKVFTENGRRITLDRSHHDLAYGLKLKPDDKIKFSATIVAVNEEIWPPQIELKKIKYVSYSRN
jgi:hypothetical protein